MILSSNISYSYPNNAQVLTFPDLQCAPKEMLLVLGQSGCGKTTLLHILGGVLKPTSGSIRINEVSLYDLSSAQLDKKRGQDIGFIFQRSHFLASLTVKENLQLAQKLAGKPIDTQRIESILARLNLSHKLDVKASRLSVGEQQRVAIARALINRPKVILADEPTSALDDHNTKQVIELLEEQAQQENAALIIVTHDARLKSYIPTQIELS